MFKKLFSLFAALTLSVGLWAEAPVAQKAQVANLNQLSATPELKVINQEAKAPAVKPAARKLATGEPIVVIIKGNPQIVSKSGKTTIEATGNDDIIYGWVIPTESLEAGKTYTYADMGEHNVYRYDNSFTVYEEATDGTFSIDAAKNITASMVTESGTYMVYTKAPQPEPVEITLVADTLNFFTKMLNAGFYQMQGYTADSTYAFSFYFKSKSITGNFTEEDMDAYSTWVDEKEGKKTVVSYQNLSAANIKASLVKDTLYYTGTMTLATNDGQEANITLNLSCPFKQFDSNAPFDATFAYEDMKSSISNGVISISATNAENFTIGLVLYAAPTATTIPEGTYTISDSQEAGTALKSLGVNGGYPIECFAGTRDASGSINVPCWFMVEGTVTLSYDEYGKLKVVVDAKNSYKQPVTVLVQYSATTTALPSLFDDGVKANKFLYNGQLIIRKDGKTYNAMGAEVTK